MKENELGSLSAPQYLIIVDLTVTSIVFCNFWNPIGLNQVSQERMWHERTGLGRAVGWGQSAQTLEAGRN